MNRPTRTTDPLSYTEMSVIIDSLVDKRRSTGAGAAPWMEYSMVDDDPDNPCHARAYLGAIETAITKVTYWLSILDSMAHPQPADEKIAMLEAEVARTRAEVIEARQHALDVAAAAESAKATVANAGTPELRFDHTFNVPLENMGGHNHGPREWIYGLLHDAGITDFDLDLPETSAERAASAPGVAAVRFIGPERGLYFLCRLFDLGAEQLPSDTTDPKEAERLEETIRKTKAWAEMTAMPAGPERTRLFYKLNGWLTLGFLRKATEGESDDVLMTLYDGDNYKHLTIIEQTEESEPTIILGIGNGFDSMDV